MQLELWDTKPSTTGGGQVMRQTTGGRHMKTPEDDIIEKLWQDTQPRTYTISISDTLTGLTVQYCVCRLEGLATLNLAMLLDAVKQGTSFLTKYQTDTT